MTVGGLEKVTMLVCGLESWVDWSISGGTFIVAREGTHSCTRVMVNCSIENVDTVTDNAEYRSGSVSAREVGWQTCPGVLFIGAKVSESAFRS
jgi:hypothetical protein